MAVDTNEINSQTKDVITHDYTFTGESAHWSAVLEIEGEEVFYKEEEVLKRDENVTSEFRLSYKDPMEAFASTREFRYAYETPSSSSGTQRTFETPPKEKTFVNKSNNLVREDDRIQVTVEWDDHKENFTLELEK